MPIYEYQCISCNKRENLFFRSYDDANKNIPIWASMDPKKPANKPSKANSRAVDFCRREVLAPKVLNTAD